MTARHAFQDQDGGQTIEWASDGVGEVPPAPAVAQLVQTIPSPLDHVAGLAYTSGLEVQSGDMWCVCICGDGEHATFHLLHESKWGDGMWRNSPAWHTDRADAVQDLTYYGGHIVLRPVRHITGPIETAEEPNRG